MDERKHNYETVVCRFDKYLRNFQNYVSEDQDEHQRALTERNRSNKKKKVNLNLEEVKPRHLPEL